MTAVDFASFVERLAQVSGDVILPFFRSAIGAEDKSRGGVFDPVTEADRGAEAAMRRLIGQTFPAHGVIGEEYGVDRPDAEYVWVLDPIDGTKSFISGMPTWGTLIGLMHNGRPVYGMMAQPFTRERFTGDGKRARLRTLAVSRGDAPPSDWTTRALRTRPCASIAEATLSTTHPALIRDPADRAAFHRVEAQARLSRYGGDCYGYCALAAGFIDVVIETNLKPHDVVALVPIVEGAGGIMTTWEGDEASKGGRIVAAGDRRVYEEARALLTSV
ncbi:myo-inositol-1(or 4)-monophosphatase [Roseiarcus fermentans]|uniref:Histidinol-phosphatase n=1 Tax=Roseiarcus fermentans TaxID=1473586 RepID=A0A366FPX0_9HYPH|nr:histidinol-phosphatase [Roseiarcus fermentans]RBP15765.1 myo-inositol-1(or 4)-monophosphatase [Roseiarcus fermentans]